MKNQYSWVVAKGTETMRLDKAIRLELPHLGRRMIKHMLNSKQVKLNGRLLWLGSWLVNPGDQIMLLNLPEIQRSVWKSLDPDWIIEETQDYVLVNKPSGMLVHPVQDPTRENLEFFMQEQYGRIRPAHRLDRDTSGLIIFSRTREMNQVLDEVFKKHTIQKTYLALVKNSGKLNEQGVVKQRLGQHEKRRDMTQIDKYGKKAITHYRLLGRTKKMALLEMQPVTGRMHQLRVHMAWLDAPIFNDRLYGSGKFPQERLMLHAWKIEIPEGVLHEKEYTASYPDDFLKLIPDQLQTFLPRE